LTREITILKKANNDLYQKELDIKTRIKDMEIDIGI